MERKKANPKHLALGAFAGALVAGSSYFTTLAARGNRAWLWVLPAQAVVGFGVWFGVDSRLKRLYRAGVWDDSELAPVRALLASRAWVWVSLTLLLVAVGTSIWSGHFNGMIYIAIMPVNAITSMWTALKPPVQSKAGWLPDWASIKPLRSQHWGEARSEQNGEVSQ